MNLNLSDYWDILTSYTNPFSIIFSAFKYAALVFFIFLLLVIFLRKFILVKRKYVLFTILAWIFIFMAPLLGGYFGFKWGLIYGIKNDLQTHMHTYTSGLDKVLNDAIGISAEEFVDELKNGKDSANLNLTANEAVDKFAVIVCNKFGSTLDETAKTKGKITAFFLHIIQTEGISLGLKEGIRKLLHDELGVDEGTSKEVMSTKFKTLLDKGLFTEIMNAQVDHFFSEMFKSLYILFGAILFFPILEIVISNII